MRQAVQTGSVFLFYSGSHGRKGLCFLLYNHIFLGGNCLHTAGVAGSIPAAPTNKTKHLASTQTVPFGLSEPGTVMDAKTQARFWAKVDQSGECWEWTAACFRRGYGAFSYAWGDRPGRRTGYAHRFSYELHKGPIPEGCVILHLCDNPRCVNPDHLKAGTQAENIRDCLEKDRWMTPERKAHLERFAESTEREPDGRWKSYAL